MSVPVDVKKVDESSVRANIRDQNLELQSHLHLNYSTTMKCDVTEGIEKGHTTDDIMIGRDLNQADFKGTLENNIISSHNLLETGPDLRAGTAGTCPGPPQISNSCYISTIIYCHYHKFIFSLVFYMTSMIVKCLKRVHFLVKHASYCDL